MRRYKSFRQGEFEISECTTQILISNYETNQKNKLFFKIFLYGSVVCRFILSQHSCKSERPVHNHYFRSSSCMKTFFLIVQLVKMV